MVAAAGAVTEAAVVWAGGSWTSTVVPLEGRSERACSAFPSRVTVPDNGSSLDVRLDPDLLLKGGEKAITPT